MDAHPGMALQYEMDMCVRLALAKPRGVEGAIRKVGNFYFFFKRGVFVKYFTNLSKKVGFIG